MNIQEPLEAEHKSYQRSRFGLRDILAVIGAGACAGLFTVVGDSLHHTLTAFLGRASAVAVVVFVLRRIIRRKKA